MSYWLLARICLPYMKSTHGTGNNMTAINPSKLVAHPIPSFEYTAGVISV